MSPPEMFNTAESNAARPTSQKPPEMLIVLETLAKNGCSEDDPATRLIMLAPNAWPPDMWLPPLVTSPELRVWSWPPPVPMKAPSAMLAMLFSLTRTKFDTEAFDVKVSVVG